MRILVDSNILCRLGSRDDPQHEEARQALRIALQRGDELFICPQVEREFWAVATRPRANNGLGMTPEETAASLREWRESFFQFAPDSPAVHATWQDLVEKQFEIIKLFEKVAVSLSEELKKCEVALS